MCTRNIAVASLLLAMAGSAFGQNALDRPLDKNPQKGSGGLNTRTAPDIAAEVRFRNAIVTGNAPGGLSFRGDVGYKAPGEFFGNLGTNDTFTFRRDSYYSGLGGLGIRGTDALQYQFALTTGNNPPPGFAGNLSVSRSGTAPTSAAAASGGISAIQTAESGGGIKPAKPNPYEVGADMRGLSLLSIRSPSAYVASRGLEPTFLGRIKGPDGAYAGVTASPLRGISYDEEAVAKKEVKAGTELQRALDTRVNDRIPSTPVNPREETRADTKVSQEPSRSSYDELMDRLKGTAKDKEETKDAKGTPVWQKELDELRRQLGAQAKPEAKPEEIKPKEGTPAPGDQKDKTKEDESKDESRDSLRPETLEKIRDSGALLQHLVTPGFDAYATHMKAGQDYLVSGQFFFAEERFTAALAVKTGDPMAAIGRVHAQLGAGMFLSAAINLKGLLVEHPEVAALKYGPELMPTPERVRSLVDRLGAMADSKDGKRRDAALLLAYLGFQSGDDKAMKHGLAVMGEAPAPAPDAKPAEGPDHLQKLAAFLNGVWTKPAATPKPAPAATEPPKPEPPKPEPPRPEPSK